MDSKFIINLQGRSFVKYEGLLDEAHRIGLLGISTELIQIPSAANQNTAIVKAVAKAQGGKEFHGLGDANPANVGRGVSQHIIRMAETRAKARALRDLTNIGMTAIEELGDDVSGNDEPYETPPKPAGLVCSECGAQVTQKVAEYSQSKYGRILCFDCQRREGGK